MAFPDIFKLEKLRIYAFSDYQRQTPAQPVDSFDAMFNPETLSREFGFTYRAAQTVGDQRQPAQVTFAPPASLNVKLLIDGSGVAEMGLIKLFAPPPSVDEQIASFLKLAFETNGATHRPNFLRLSYGEIKFDCLLSKVTINQQSFDRQGKTVRAELDVELIQDEQVPEELRRTHFSSPDVSHSRAVRAGDTLPLLAAEIYGSPRHHLAVARANGLDQPRMLEPGTVLLFPPLAR
jgi:nucleoid-associated protein YgaU